MLIGWKIYIVTVLHNSALRQIPYDFFGLNIVHVDILRGYTKSLTLIFRFII